jgi:Flp pilus assembly protein TadG
MRPSTHLARVRSRTQNGAATVEFALVASIFFMMLLAICDFGRLMFSWNTTAEVTRRGARLAVVCDLNSAQIKTQMRNMLPVLANGDIQITYNPGGCTANTCESVTVQILPGGQSASAMHYYIPGLNSWKLPAFATTLTRESLQNGSGLDVNPDCS